MGLTLAVGLTREPHIAVRSWILAIAFLTSVLSWGQSRTPPSAAGKAEKGLVSVQSETAEQNLIKKVAPVFPPLARMARLQGVVKIEVVISKTGSVESYKVLSGHPLFVQSAIDAVKQWQFKPFLVDDQPVTTKTVVEVPFSLGVPDAEYKAEQKNNQIYFKREDECRNLLKQRRYGEAEAPCRSLVELSERLPLERQLERMTANQLSGHVLFYQRKYAEALIFYQRELAIGTASLKPTEAELGYAYYDVAMGFHATGEIEKAQSNYERAEATLRKAREQIGSESLKNEYSKSIQSVLRHLIALLRETGQDEAATQAQQRADAIAREIRP